MIVCKRRLSHWQRWRIKKRKDIMKAKSFYESKTFWFNGLFLLVSVAAAFGFASWQPDSLWLEIVGVIVAGVNIALRLITASAIK